MKPILTAWKVSSHIFPVIRHTKKDTHTWNGGVGSLILYRGECCIYILCAHYMYFVSLNSRFWLPRIQPSGYFPTVPWCGCSFSCPMSTFIQTAPFPKACSKYLYIHPDIPVPQIPHLASQTCGWWFHPDILARAFVFCSFFNFENQMGET